MIYDSLKIMKAREVTIEMLFAGRVEFVAPSFQRPYGWKRSACEKILSAMSESDSMLFQGAVVSMDIASRQSEYRKGLLVDGNHRLMTVLAVILAVRDRLAALIPDASGDIDANCFLNEPPNDGHLFKNIVPKKDRAVFEALVLRKKPKTHANALFRAYQFAFDYTASYDTATLGRCIKALTERLTFVSLELDRDEDPYPIFKLLSVPNEDFTRRGLVEYTRFSKDPAMMALIAGGESQELEFKERTISAVKHEGPVSGAAGIVRSVAGFMNSDKGGTLLIGIRDDGGVRGVEDEFALVDHGKSNWDGYLLFINNILRTRLSTENPFLYYSAERRIVQNHTICMIKVKPSRAPVYLDKHLFVRSGNQTIEMLGPDLVNYVTHRFTKSETPTPEQGI